MSIASEDSKQRRYPGFASFEEKDRALFFGRDKERTEILQLIQLEQIVVLYGKSGLGKTSLINAGLIPSLKGEYAVTRLRFYSYKSSESSEELPVSPLQRLLTEIQAIPKDQQLKLPIDHIEGEDSLWYHLKKATLVSANDGAEESLNSPTKRNVILFLDQFEELFSYPSSQRDELFRNLAGVLNDTIPRGYRRQLKSLRTNPEKISDEIIDLLYEKINLKVIISIRSDRLNLLNEAKSYFPGIFNNLYELLPLRREAAKQAIIRPASRKGANYYSPPFIISEKAIENTLSYLSKTHNQKIEAFQLQIVCQYFEEIIIKEVEKKAPSKEHRIDTLHTIALKGLMGAFYERTLEKVSVIHRTVVRQVIEEQLIFTPDKQRVSVYEGKLLKEVKGLNEDILNQLVATRLVRKEKSSTGVENYELVHDTLVEPILKYKAEKLSQKPLDENVQKLKEEAQKKKEEEAIIAKQQQQLEYLNQQLSRLQQNFLYRMYIYCIATFRKNSGLVNTIIEQLLERGNIHLSLNNLTKASNDFRLGLSFYKSTKLYNNYAVALFRQRKYKEAEEAIAKAISLEQTPRVVNNQSMLMLYGLIEKGAFRFTHNKRRRQEDTLRDIEDKLKYAVRNEKNETTYIRVNQGIMEFVKGNLQEAKESFNRYTQKKRDAALGISISSISNNNLGVAQYLENYNIEEALGRLDLAIAAEPNLVQAYLNRGILYFRKETYHKAVADFTKVIEEWPDHAITYRLRGLCYWNLYNEYHGNLKKALVDFRKFNELTI